MPRLQPPPGYTTARDAANRIGVSEALLSRYVEKGKLKRYGPENRKHKFYKISEIEALLMTERLFIEEYQKGAWRKNPSSTFELAKEEDIPYIYDIDARTFPEEGPAAPLEICLNWYHKNPHTFYTLRNEAGIITGYGSMLPMDRETRDRFIRDEIHGEDITPDYIPEYEPGQVYHLYIMALAVDPRYKGKEKREYGARIVAGLSEFLLDLASQGIEIETITARSYKPDGLRLLRKMGFPQLRSSVPGKNLFMVRVPESGYPLFERYTEILNDWKETHKTPQATRSRITPGETTLPSGYRGFTDFFRDHGIPESTADRAAKAGIFEIATDGWRVDGYPVKKALDPTAQRLFCQHFHHRAPQYHECSINDCPCHQFPKEKTA